MSSALSPAAVVSPPSPAEAPSARRWLGRFSTRALERAGLALLSLASLTGFLVFPTYPNYDSYYSLLWGRELLGLDHLSFTAYRAPTEHPLAIAFGALLTPLGNGADRVGTDHRGRLCPRQDRLHAARRRRGGGAAGDAL